jgi:hypothetical protein
MLVDVRSTLIGYHNNSLPPESFAQQGGPLVRMLLARAHSAQG